MNNMNMKYDGVVAALFFCFPRYMGVGGICKYFKWYERCVSVS